MPSASARTRLPYRTARWLAGSLGIGLALAAPGCLSEVQVLDEEGADAGSDQVGGQVMMPADGFGATGTAGSGMMVPITPSGGESEPSEDPAMQAPQAIDPDEPPGAPWVAPTCGNKIMVVPPRCAEAEVLITDLSDVYDVSVTGDHVYAATWGGLFRAPRGGGTRETLVDAFTSRVLADPQRFFWNASMGEVFVQQGTEDASSFLPTHGSVDALLQDDDALFALTDGYLMRVPKDGGEAEILVDGTNGMASLHWSGIALDDAHAYFVSYGTQLTLERIGKDGDGREVLLGGVGGAMDTIRMLVDESHVYYASVNGSLQRVPLDGGQPEGLVAYSDGGFDSLVMAVDDECLYYTDGSSIRCLNKTKCTTEVVYTADEGTVTALAMHGSELYFGVTAEGPAATPNGWVGSLDCATGD